MTASSGPLAGYRVLELAGIGPSPMTGMMLADMGADVIRIERASGASPGLPRDPSFRNKRSIVLDLKRRRGVEVFLKLAAKSDVVIEGYRPGVAERLGVGPDACHAVNPKLVYGRMTGWGQDGPLAHAAGHDINYIALTGVLHAIGRRGEPPVPPLNLIGDMGGGGVLLVVGVLAALLEAQRSGQGQVIDAAMTDGSALLMWIVHGLAASGMWNARERESNLLDGAAHFYGTYETADNKYLAVGAIEPQFYAEFLERAGLDPAAFQPQLDHSRWPALRERLRAHFLTRTRDEWCELLEGTDACVAPVLTLEEAPSHPHNAARGTYVDVDGFMQPAPAPRFSRTPAGVRHGRRESGADTDAVLREAGVDEAGVRTLREDGVLA